MKYEVLVVDDVAKAASDFALLISNKTKIPTISTDNPSEALSITSNNPIKIVVLDQRMPRRRGIELFDDLMRVNPMVKAIMITGEADGEEVGLAMQKGFVDYVHKSKILELPERVLYHYCAYHAELSQRNSADPSTIYSWSMGFIRFRSDKINFYHLFTKVVNSEYIKPESWRAVARIDAGERISKRISHGITQRLVLESTERDKLAARASMDFSIIKGLESGIETVIEQEFRSEISKERRDEETVERTFELPKEPTDPNILHVKSRIYEMADVYRRLRIYIKKTCSCCGGDEIIICNAYHATGSMAARQVDFWSNGTKQVTDTGVFKI